MILKICKFYSPESQYTDEKHKWVCDPCNRFGDKRKLEFVELCYLHVNHLRYTNFYCDLAESQIIKHQREFSLGP